MTYTCSLCTDSYTEEIAATGVHNYVDGSCTVCGKDDPNFIVHEHQLCPECNKCTAADCDGAENEKCMGHSTKYVFTKVTSAPSDWSGTYLIVYEDGSVAFNGDLSTLDAVGNTMNVSIENNTITLDNLNGTFAISKSNSSYTIQSKSGYYIGATANSNSLVSNTATKYTNTLSINSDGTVNIVGSGGAYLRFNAASNQNRFRYYKSSSYTNQKAITLYKLSE